MKTKLSFSTSFTSSLLPIITPIVIPAVLGIFLVGCVHLEAKSLPQKHYAITVAVTPTPGSNASANRVTKTGNIANASGITSASNVTNTSTNALPTNLVHKNQDYVLEIYSPQIAAQFASSNFIYRTSEINYSNDYYNIFFGFPAEQIQQNTIKYLQASKIFNYASDNLFPLKADYALKTNITELYADYRDPKSPKAVMSIQYVLINLQKQPPAVIFDKTFSESIPLTEKSSHALVEGWNKDLQKILSQLVVKLQKTES